MGLVACLHYFLASSSALYRDAVEDVLAGRVPFLQYLLWASLLALAWLRWYTGYRVCWVSYVDEVIMTDQGDVMGMRNGLPGGLKSPLLPVATPVGRTADRQESRSVPFPAS